VTAVRTGGGIVVIDAFISIEAGRHGRTLIDAAFPNLPIRYLIHTHHHADHLEGNPCFDGAVIVAHVNLEKHLLDEQKKRVLPSFQITSDTILKIGGKAFEVLYFGAAHTDNDVAVLDREDKLLIMGDLLCHRKCYILGPQSDALNWIDLLEELISRRDEYESVIPGHGGVVLGVEALEEQRDYLRDLHDAVKSARQKNLSLEQAQKVIRLERYREYIYFDRIDRDIEACWKQARH
jgi:glyoxylase-like metal-dependent hydrolase (beta-lactamase superfamily II)